MRHAGTGQRGEQGVDFMRLRCAVDAIPHQFGNRLFRVADDWLGINGPRPPRVG
jgi:hypothetical protein